MEKLKKVVLEVIADLRHPSTPGAPVQCFATMAQKLEDAVKEAQKPIDAVKPAKKKSDGKAD